MSERTFCDITDEPLSDEGARNLEDQLAEAKQRGALWFGLCIRNGDADGLFARLRKAEAERDAGRAKVEKLREALRKVRKFDPGACFCAVVADGCMNCILRAALAETEGSDG